VKTTPLTRQPRLKVHTLGLEVLAGPDQGKRAEAPSEVMTIGSAPGNDLVLTDKTVSRFHLELTRTDTGILVKDLRSTNGTLAGSVRIDQGAIEPGTVLRLGATEVRVLNGAETVVEVLEEDHFHDLRGNTPQMRRLMAQIARVARTSVPVLILGESGTGKELVARAIHDHSERSAGPFVVVDCGALAPTLVASELFGHEKGAFTGAERTHIGAFERAQGGTLFLDEVGELSAELQPQLLGALERRQLRRVGGKADIPLDVRVVTATNRDLRAEVNAGSFRMDVYFRIAVVVLKIPPLRERRSDLPLLVEHFVRQAGHEGPLEEVLPAGALAELERHAWPGNVRELRNWVEATLALGESPELFVSGPDAAAQATADAIGCEPALLELPYKDARDLLLRRFERRYLDRLVERAGDNVTRAARLARMDRSYLIRLLQRHQKRDGRDGPADELGDAEAEG